jgi:hypothetical protein
LLNRHVAAKLDRLGLEANIKTFPRNERKEEKSCCDNLLDSNPPSKLTTTMSGQQKTQKSRSDKGPRGRPSWVVGTKFVFLSQYSEDWRMATDHGVVVAGRFYTKITKRFIKKYGWHFNRWEDKECADLDEETIDDEESDPDIDNEELAQRSLYYKELREVSTFHL